MNLKKQENAFKEGTESIQAQPVRLAEWSKAPDLSSGSRERAWVRTPHLTIQPFGRISLVG